MQFSTWQEKIKFQPQIPLRLNWSFDFGDSPMSPEWKDRVTKLLKSMPEVFTQHILDYGHSERVKHHIKLSDDTPFKHRARPIHPQDVDEVKKHLQEPLDSGVIWESESPFASPIVVVRKKAGSMWLCIDFQKLNSQTIKMPMHCQTWRKCFPWLAQNGSQSWT